MPDKNHKCGSGCLRCWRNKLKHANPQVKSFIKKHNVEIIVYGDDNDYKAMDERNKKTFIKEERKRLLNDKVEGCKIIKSNYKIH